MKPEKVWKALEQYAWELKARGWKPQQMPRKDYDRRMQAQTDPATDSVMLYEHCAWMVHHCLTVFRPEENVEKAMRWLCYVQGVLHARGMFTCNELRDHSFGGEVKGEEEPHLRALRIKRDD